MSVIADDVISGSHYFSFFVHLNLGLSYPESSGVVAAVVVTRLASQDVEAVESSAASTASASTSTKV